MKFNSFFSQWESTKTANVVLLIAVGAMAVANVMLSLDLMRTKVERELIPPRLDQQVRVGYASADAAYYKSWGLYVAELVGNISPGNANFVAEALGRLFTSSDAQHVRTQVLAEGHSLQQNGSVMYFKAKELVYDPDTQTVFVTGTQRQISPDGSSLSAQEFTYQMQVKIVQGQPVLTGLTAYPGSAHTKAWLAGHPKMPASAASSASAPVSQ